MSDLMDDVRDDGPSESEVLGWQEANDHPDEWPQDGQDMPDGNVEPFLEHQLNRLADTLFRSLDALEQRIEERAEQLARPRIVEAERRAAAAEQRAEQAEKAHEQRSGDLRRELVRQMDVLERKHWRLWWLSQYLPGSLRALVTPMPQALAAKLPEDWRAMTARRASPDFDEAAEAELRLLAQGIVLVVEGQTAAQFQRRMRIGFATAGKLLDRMEELGVVGPMEGRKRKVLAGRDALPDLLAPYGFAADEVRL
ncbi:DNA translocase FtsK [Nonomuraea sp. NPDC026600]|uniref:DNA translocase FtsK n=1 Tax=Nonomuraea sp. NPDC026600 TaxID=3155363 RepID=UPI0033E7891C